MAIGFERLNNISPSKKKLYGYLASISFAIFIVIIVWICVAKDRSGSSKPSKSTSYPTPTTPSIVTSTEIISTTPAANGTCEISPLSQTSPLLFKTGTSTLIYPKAGSNSTTFSGNESVDFSCPGNDVTTGINSYGPLVTAICQNGEVFGINGAKVQWGNITCSRGISVTVKEVQISDLKADDPVGNCFEVNSTNKVAYIGFNLTNGRFLRVVDICFNFTSKIALYSYHNLSASINSRASNISRISFLQDEPIYRMGTSVNSLYNNSQATINSILGLEPNSTKYINATVHINRGHLAPRADFMYASMQNSVQRYINVAPQWSTFNGGTWENIERDIRNYANNKTVDLQIWTGTYGTASLPHENSTLPHDNSTLHQDNSTLPHDKSTLPPENLYLYVNGTGTNTQFVPSFPVPALFWKLVYEPLSESAVVFVGQNNPYLSNITMICKEDVSQKLNWTSFDKDNAQKGLCYVCNYNDSMFQTLIPFVPKINVTQLLL